VFGYSIDVYMQDCNAVSASTGAQQFPTEIQVLADLKLFKLQSSPNKMANAKPVNKQPVSIVYTQSSK
jgi:hypothetical protein